MPINKSSLQARINNLSQKTGVHQNILLKTFFFDAFLKRLSKSKHAEHFVFKGGFLLSSVLGISQRSTMDMDFLIQKMDLSEETVAKVTNEVIGIDAGDGVRFKWKGIEKIRQEDEYGGYRITVVGELENIKDTIAIDIATGDPITPKAVGYQYRCLLSEETLCFQAYNFETILAEKLQTILSRGILNSRSKDFFDIFIIHKLRWNEVDGETLGKAFAATCAYRQTVFTDTEAKQILQRIKEDQPMSQRWESYRKKNKFAAEVEFQDVVEAALAVAGKAFVD